jgi:hypothetical protein
MSKEDTERPEALTWKTMIRTLLVFQAEAARVSLKTSIIRENANKKSNERKRGERNYTKNSNSIYLHEVKKQFARINNHPKSIHFGKDRHLSL